MFKRRQYLNNCFHFNSMLLSGKMIRSTKLKLHPSIFLVCLNVCMGKGWWLVICVSVNYVNYVTRCEESWIVEGEMMETKNHKRRDLTMHDILIHIHFFYMLFIVIQLMFFRPFPNNIQENEMIYKNERFLCLSHMCCLSLRVLHFLLQ